ncbi:hypothetical protein RFI_03023 [Reticulomyxa filosa]|uniref:Uncharacterized protein n=1 Tax=Reticulomyxa filosa TaxID=46433 RepID=X6P7H5_RETFI|nr:hypothetical protein RFI_03023 [Reticulomyxa filosa]|eukprot:ETO34073.1 hypothetical protein RFI_03023 [Reticulomyxa filosa]
MANHVAHLNATPFFFYKNICKYKNNNNKLNKLIFGSYKFCFRIVSENQKRYTANERNLRKRRSKFEDKKMSKLVMRILNGTKVPQKYLNSRMEVFMPSDGKEDFGAVATDDMIALDDKHKSDDVELAQSAKNQN